MNSPQWPRGIPSFTFKEWLANEAGRIGISASALKGRIDRGKHPRPLRIFKSCNVTSVVLWHPQTGAREATEGLMLLGDWIKKESVRSGSPVNTIRSRFRRGKYPALKIHRFNQSKVFVSE